MIILEVSTNNILHQAQHGFTKGRSTLTNLLESVNDWTLCLQNKQQVDVVYIDFRKAFDVEGTTRIWHATIPSPTHT